MSRKFFIPNPPFAVGLRVSSGVRQWPLARARMSSSAVYGRFQVSTLAAAALWLWRAVFGDFTWYGGSLSLMAWFFSIAAAFNLVMLLCRWVVVCPVCQNGYYAGYPVAWHCHHCGLHISADDLGEGGSTPPWGARE